MSIFLFASVVVKQNLFCEILCDSGEVILSRVNEGIGLEISTVLSGHKMA